jgi:hypothetical protein
MVMADGLRCTVSTGTWAWVTKAPAGGSVPGATRNLVRNGSNCDRSPL